MEAEYDYICYYKVCERIFNSKYNLQRHINSKHLSIKNYSCSLCGKKVVSKQNLIEHEYIHTGDKPFECPVPGCGKRYRQSSQLCVHKKAHTKKGEACSQSLDDLKERVYVKRDRRGLELPYIDEERVNEQVEINLPVLHQLLDFSIYNG